MKIIESNPEKLKKAKQNDPKRFIKTTNITTDGELADKSIYEINQSIIDEEARYDGLYAVCTNLEDSVEDIIKVNHRRWKIEESFRIMKTDLTDALHDKFGFRTDYEAMNMRNLKKFLDKQKNKKCTQFLYKYQKSLLLATVSIGIIFKYWKNYCIFI